MEKGEVKNCILNGEAIQRKLRRMAFQIAEHNQEEQELYIAGINGNGELVARSLVKHLEAVASFRIKLFTIHLDKSAPVGATLSEEAQFTDKVVIVTDDVANSGKIMLYALQPFLPTYPRRLQTLVLVERSHKLFPVQNDYVGLSLSTTLQEHISVETEGEELIGAWLY
jgi:pyrimidine operon attenuation protein/uracil phosphoribosyltransferase